MGRKMNMKKIILTSMLIVIYACTTVFAAVYYPVSIDESTVNGITTITKSYELNIDDDVTAISKEGLNRTAVFLFLRTW